MWKETHAIPRDPFVARVRKGAVALRNAAEPAPRRVPGGRAPERALVHNLENEDVNRLADAVLRGEYDVDQDELQQARDDLAAATRRRDGLALAVNKQRAVVIACCEEHRQEWDAELEPKHQKAVKEYRAVLDKLYEKQREIERIMDARALLERPHEDRRSHYTSRFVNRSRCVSP
jgi:hypothetical protein